MTCSLSVLALAICVAVAEAAAGQGYYPPTSARPKLEMLGWDSAAHRIYYLVTFPMYRTDKPPDSTRVLRWFELDSARPQEPRSGAHVGVGSREDSALLVRVNRLRLTCAQLDSVGGPGRAGIREVGQHNVWMGDCLHTIHHLRISLERWTGEYQTYAECNSLDLSVRVVYAVPGRDEAVAVLDRPSRVPQCDVSMVMLLAQHPLPVREHDLSQVP